MFLVLSGDNTLVLDQKHLGGDRALRADDQCLLDVGGFGGAGEEKTEIIDTELLDAGVGLVHGGDEGIVGEEDGEVLGEGVAGAVIFGVMVDPAGSVFDDTEMGVQYGGFRAIEIFP